MLKFKFTVELIFDDEEDFNAEKYPISVCETELRMAIVESLFPEELIITPITEVP